MKTGDIVYLKSGSPPLTVSDPLCPPRLSLIDVHWFAGSSLVRDVIHQECLTTEAPTIVYKEEIFYES